MTTVDIDLIGVPVFIIDVEDDGGFRVVAINQADADALGLTASEVAGRRVEDCTAPDIAGHVIKRFSACVSTCRFLEYDEVMHTEGTARWWRTTLTPFLDRETGRVTRIVGVSVEITERKHAEAQLARAVVLDPLTGVLNRRGLEGSVSDAISNPDASGRIALIVIDLDDFKAINDAHGHQIGDAVLLRVAQQLQASVSSDEVVARLGGDEFALILSVDDEADLERRVALLRRGLAGDQSHAGIELRVGASVGSALWTNGLTRSDLVSRADAEMYRHKRTSGAGVRETAQRTGGASDRRIPRSGSDARGRAA